MDTMYRCFKFSKDHIDAYEFDSYSTAVDHCSNLTGEGIFTILFMKNEEDTKWARIAEHVTFQDVKDPVGDLHLPIVFHDVPPNDDGEWPAHWDNLP